jgi:hypothetical protein
MDSQVVEREVKYTTFLRGGHVRSYSFKGSD